MILFLPSVATPSLVFSGERVWRNYGYFDARKSIISIMFDNQKDIYIYVFYCNFFIVGQILKSSNPPKDVSSYNLKENEVKTVRPRCDPG